MKYKAFTYTTLFMLCAGCTLTFNKSPKKSDPVWPKLTFDVTTDPIIESKVQAIVATMTLEQKVAQMIQPEIRDITVEDMRRYGFGSYLNGGGAFPNNNKQASAHDWVELAEQMYQASVDDSLDGSKIPTMWGTDAVHGHNNVIGATLFPHNIGLGAANNPELIEQIAQVTAKEVMVTGIDWVFAPTVAVVRDDRWGRTYEGYSEDPAIVGKYAKAIVSGLQGTVGKDFLNDYKVVSTVKHFLGDGGTIGGDDQGNNIDSEQELFAIHAQGYVEGLRVGAQTVMASFNSWHGEKLHGHKYLLTDVLKKRMGFDGFVVGDWNGHGQVKGCSNESCSQSINAGLDVFMVPSKAWKPLLNNTIAQVKAGEIKEQRINDAVTRILRVKMRAGLFDKPSPAKRPLSGKTELIGHNSHREIAKQAVRESLVLLKNNNNLLPLSANSNVLVAGDGAHNIGKQSGGWTITWQGTGNQNSDFPGGSSIFDGIKSIVEEHGGKVELSEDGTFLKKPDVAIVVFGEDPYAEGNGDLQNLEYQRGDKKDLALLKSIKEMNIPVVSIFLTGRPLWVNPEINASDAFVVAWLPGSEGSAVADVLFLNKSLDKLYDFKGKLSYSWPKQPSDAALNVHDLDYDPLFPYGFGLTYKSDTNLLFLNETITQTSSLEQDYPILQGTVQKPWSMQLNNGSVNKIMNSNTLQINGVAVRTIDKIVQEDARQFSFTGDTDAKVAIAHAFPEDLRDYTQENSVLSFDIKVSNEAIGNTKLGINCDLVCSNGQLLSDLIQQNHLNEWQTIKVNTQCFGHKNLAKVFSPFAIASSTDSQISIANIKLIKEYKGNNVYHCH